MSGSDTRRIVMPGDREVLLDRQKRRRAVDPVETIAKTGESPEKTVALNIIEQVKDHLDQVLMGEGETKNRVALGRSLVEIELKAQENPASPQTLRGIISILKNLLDKADKLRLSRGALQLEIQRATTLAKQL